MIFYQNIFGSPLQQKHKNGRKKKHLTMNKVAKKKENMEQ